MDLRAKREVEYARNVQPVKHLIEGWFNRAATKFLKKRKLKDEAEKLLEDFSDYCLTYLEELTPSKALEELEKEREEAKQQELDLRTRCVLGD